MYLEKVCGKTSSPDSFWNNTEQSTEITAEILERTFVNYEAQL